MHKRTLEELMVEVMSHFGDHVGLCLDGGEYVIMRHSIIEDQ